MGFLEEVKSIYGNNRSVNTLKIRVLLTLSLFFNSKIELKRNVSLVFSKCVVCLLFLIENVEIITRLR